MTKNDSSCTLLTDAQLIAEVARLTNVERCATAHLIAAIAELDVRRLYLGEGCSSLFTYCTQVLHLSEHAAYGRIETARAARRFPIILQMLADGSVTVTSVRLLASSLTAENHRDLLNSATHKSKREVEEIATRLRPRPDVPAMVRKLPAPQRVLTPVTTGSLTVPKSAVTDGTSQMGARTGPAAASAEPLVTPLAPERYKIQFSVGRGTYQKLRQVQNLMRHSVPTGDPAVIFDRALTVLLAELEKAKLAATKSPRAAGSARPGGRHIPAAVKRAVWRRDGGQCAFTGARGRCIERGRLEFHHVKPFATGGLAVAENIELRCAAHNQYEADLFFGRHDLPMRTRERPSGSYAGGLGLDRVPRWHNSGATCRLETLTSAVVRHG